MRLRQNRRSFVLMIFVVVLTIAPAVEAELPELIGRIVSDTTRTLFGTTIVPLGDQNDDGYADILVWDYRPAAYLFYGGVPLDTVYDLSFNGISPGIGNVGDVNDDGYDDFSTNGQAPGNWKLNLYYGGPTLDSVRDLWFGENGQLAYGPPVNGLDINANGSIEIIARGFDGDHLLFYELGLDSDSIADLVLRPAYVTKPGYQFGDGFIVGDFNGDDTTDLVVNLRPNPSYLEDGALYLYWGGVTFDTIPDLIIHEPGEYQNGSYNFGRVLVSLGDINGDGYDDLFASPGSPYDDTLSYIFFGGPDIDTIPDVTITKRHKVAGLAGDINGDGHNDMIMSYPLPFGGGPVEVFYGGPGFDNIPDISIFPGDLPGYIIYFGMDCTGVGDMNGDGIDDFAFSSVIGSGYAAVYVFAGTSDPTDVDEEHLEPLPDEFELHQNYPNPFNAVTNIEFDLQRRSSVRLEIVNILGQRVVTLLDRWVSAGHHTTEWNGLDAAGRPVSSGVYLYRFESANRIVSRKMLLMK